MIQLKEFCLLIFFGSAHKTYGFSYYLSSKLISSLQLKLPLFMEQFYYEYSIQYKFIYYRMIEISESSDKQEPVINLIENEIKNKCKPLFDEIYYGSSDITDLDYARCRTTMIVAIGNLFVRGYFIFKKMKTEECIIFAKKKGFQTEYKYFKLMEKYSDQFPQTYFTHINSCIREINHMKKKQSHKFSVQICFVHEKASLEIINGSKIVQLMQKNNILTKDFIIDALDPSDYIINCFVPELKVRQIEQDSLEQFQKLKDILYHYIDTFGQKYKTNYYADLQKKCMTSYRIEYLINTINYMIYEQTKAKKNTESFQPMYNQIQSACWTSFNSKKKIMTSDRKDIVLTGNSRILFIDILFLKDIESHVNQEYTKQVKFMMEECRSTYNEAILKVMKITNQLDKFNGYDLIYRYQMRPINRFTKILDPL